MKRTKIPTGTYKGGKEIYLSEFEKNRLATYEESLEAYKAGYNETVDYYWYNNSAWNKKEPIGCMPAEDAEYKGADNKYFSITDLDDTIPAFTKIQYDIFKMTNWGGGTGTK